MSDARNCEIILQQTAERIAASHRICKDSYHNDVQITQHVVMSRKAIARSAELLAHVNRRLDQKPVRVVHPRGRSSANRSW
jgi:hypothetical protein